jgi:hypothetical protein
MGIKGTKQKRRETPATLRDFAVKLEEIVKSLRNTAEKMQMSGIKAIDVRYSPGAHSALCDCLRPFAFDADKKTVRMMKQ